MFGLVKDTNKNISKSQLGFTIIELIIAISIFVIISTLAVASFNSSGRKFEVKNRIKELVSLARKLKTDAGGSNKLCPDVIPGVNRTYYGTSLSFNLDKSNPTNILRGHKYQQASLCFFPPGISYGLETYIINSTSFFSPDHSIYISSIDSIPTGFSWRDLGGVIRSAVVSYLPNGTVALIDNSNNNYDPVTPGKTTLVDALLENPNNTALLYSPYDGIFVTLTDGQISVRINFMRTGLVCTDESPFPAISCAGY